MIKQTLLALAIYLSAMTVVFAQESFAQESELADRVRAANPVAVVINDPKVVTDDVLRLLKDVGFGFIGESLVKDGHAFDGKWYSTEAGVVCYGFFEWPNIVFDIQLADREALLNELYEFDIDEPPAKTAFEFPEDLQLPIPFAGLLEGQASHAYLSEDRLLVGSANREKLDAVLEAEPLAPKLNPLARNIINRSGMTIISLPIETDWSDPAFLDMLMTDTDELGQDEAKWLRKFGETLGHSQVALMGAKYHPAELLELRGCTVVETGHSFESLIDLSKSDSNWRPDVGFEHKNLVFAAAIQLEAFHSSAGPHAIPHALLASFRDQRSFDYLKGNMLQLLTELSADSWNDLTAARIGLYQNDEEERAGRFAVIGIVDAKDPSVLLGELEKLSQLTSPLMSGERANLRDEEVKRLISILASDDKNAAARARTRLLLAGKHAVPAVEKVLESTKQADQANPKLQRAARRLLSRLKRESNDPGKEVANPWFWTTLNPGMDFRQATGTLDGYTTHSIDITPDPSRDDSQNNDANATMEATFGLQWNEVKLVQVGDQFVFMLGSNVELLKRVVANVAGQSQLLMEPIQGVGDGSKRGQLHLFFETTRVVKLLDTTGRTDYRKPTESIAWACLDISKDSVGVQAMIPAKQIIPFLFRF